MCRARRRTLAHRHHRRPGCGLSRHVSRRTSQRRKVERRINEYPLKDEVLEFINAINEFKSVNQKPFPTWTEIYEIFVGLGYKKTD